MTYPASVDALTPLIQASDGPQAAETVTIPGTPYQYRLGANASPALPAGLQRIPKGAFPLDPPAVPTGTTAITSKGHFLTPSSTYKYALTNITKSGETPATNVLTATTGATATDSTGLLVALPAVTASTANPVISRRLYRSAAGLTALKWVADIEDLSLTAWADGKADDDLGVAPPSANGSGVTGVVAIAGGGYGSWLEKAPGSTLVGGDYIVDYSYSITGGLITFAAVDAGKTVTVTYTATTFVNAALFNAIITAIKETADPGLAFVVANYTLAARDRVLLVGVSGTTITLPVPYGSYGGRVLIVINGAATNTTLSAGLSSSINGAATYTLATSNTAVILVFDGSYWYIAATH